MLKRSILIAVLAICSISMNSQNFSFGVKAGANISNITADSPSPDWEHSAKTSFHGGLVLQYKFSDKFGIQSEVLYSMQGAEDGFDPYYDVNFETKDLRLNLEYINVPVLAEYGITSGLNVQLGPQIGFLIYPEQEVEYTYMDEERKQNSSLNNYTKTVDFALAGGLEYNFDMGLFIDARYNLGLTSFSENKGGSVLPDSKNSVLQFSVGYMF